jgi:hypothetical protein
LTPTFASVAIVLTLLTPDSPSGDVAHASADRTPTAIVASIDVPAPESWGNADEGRRGGQAARIEFDDVDVNAGLSAWYRLAYVDGGTRLQVYEHYAPNTLGAQSEMVLSESVAWGLASKILAAQNSPIDLVHLPPWAWVHTGNNTGPSAGLIFALSYIDVLTPGKLVGDLRVVGTGAIGLDGVVIHVSGIEAKVATAILTGPDVVFTPAPSKLIENTTIVESQHTRQLDDGYTVGEWLNVSGYEQAGRDAAKQPGTTAFVVVHDIRQVLAWLCGRTSNETTCDIARKSATIPIGTN